jgi:hypothetical protein
MTDDARDRLRRLASKGHGRGLGLADLESRWLQDSREAIERYNRRICEHGLLVDEAGLL